MTTMSKLKRKKSAVDDCRSEHPRIKYTNDSLVQESNCSKTSAISSADAVSWWERSDLSDVERLWALTLSSFCPNLPAEEECVLQLPPPSSTFPQPAFVEKVSEWRWCSPDEDANASPELPAPSFLTHPPPVKDFHPSSDSPAVEHKETPGPSAICSPEDDQPEASSKHESAAVCNELTSQQRQLKDKMSCTEAHVLSGKQIDNFGLTRNVSEHCETEHHGNAAVKRCSSLKKAQSHGTVEGIKLNTKTPSVHRYRDDSSALTGGKGREGEGSVSDMQGLGAEGLGAGGSGAGMGKESRTGGSGARLGSQTGSGGSRARLGTQSGAGGSRSEIESRAGGSGARLGSQTGSGGSGARLGSQSGAGGSGARLGTQSGAIKSAARLGSQSGAGGSGARLEAKSGESRSRTGPGAKSGTEGSGLGTESGLECCPMCLMPFPAGFSQMECDGHLAQCLSEMNEDIVW